MAFEDLALPAAIQADDEIAVTGSSNRYRGSSLFVEFGYRPWPRYAPCVPGVPVEFVLVGPVPLEPLTLISGILAGARVAPSHFRICLDFTCAGHEPRTMSLLARRHHRLIDTRCRDNRNVASFGAIFTLSL
jgi:hypothetical protein